MQITHGVQYDVIYFQNLYVVYRLIKFTSLRVKLLVMLKVGVACMHLSVKRKLGVSDE